MSAAKTSGNRFIVEETWTDMHAYVVRDRAMFDVGSRKPQLVDMFRCRKAAEQAAQLLDANIAVVDRHALLGCRITPLYSAESTREILGA